MIDAAFDQQEIEAVIERVRLKLGGHAEAAPAPISTESAVGNGIYPTSDEAVTAARAAFEAYRSMGLKKRYRIIDAVRAAMRDSAAELLAAASDIPETEATAEIDAWINHHGDDAAWQLAEALRIADETGRGLGFHALLRIGPEAADAVSRLADDPDLAPYVTVWRIDTLTGSPDDMDCAGDAERFVRLLGAVIELWGPAAALGAWAEPAAGANGLQSMVDQAWQVKLPETEQVLAAIGGGHPDKTVAKAARRSLFRYRSAG